MDDGTFKSPGIRIVINNAATQREGETLIQVFRYKYGIESSFHKNSDRYQLYIKKEFMTTLKALVKPYFHSSMYYKLRI